MATGPVVVVNGVQLFVRRFGDPALPVLVVIHGDPIWDHSYLRLAAVHPAEQASVGDPQRPQTPSYAAPHHHDPRGRRPVPLPARGRSSALPAVSSCHTGPSLSRRRKPRPGKRYRPSR
jgi:hypothetical protein